MKRIAILLALCIVSASVLTACQKASPASADTAKSTENISSAETAQSVPDEQTAEEVGTTAQNLSPGTSAEPSGRTQPGAETSSGAKDTGSTGAQTTRAGETTRKGETTRAGTSVPAGKPSSTAAQTTKGAGATTASSTKASEKTTAGGSGSVPSADPTTTKPVDTTTTTKPSSADGAISGKFSYLNGAAVTYVPALNAEDLESFGITGDKQKEILKNKNDWTAYTIQIDFRNNTDTPLTIYYLDVTDNGKNDVYVRGDTAGNPGMAANGKMSEKFFVLAPKDDADIEVRETLTHMAMRVQYAETPEDDTVVPNFKYSRIG